MPRYRLYLDESGDHTSAHATDVGKRYLGLVGVMFEQETAYPEFSRDMEAFKKTHLNFDSSSTVGDAKFPQLVDSTRGDAFHSESLVSQIIHK